ncbi:MAG: AbgT family transporter, partial [Phycisphaerales bacterium]|nr:AbgT family transporter [Phycisphaerales bacterium]
SEERGGLVAAGLVFAATIGAIVWMSSQPDSILRDPSKTGIDSYRPLFDSLVGLLMVAFILPGLAYGWWTRQIRNDRDAAKMMNQTMSAMGSYVVMAFFAAQFIEWFKKSNLGLVLALEGAAALKSIHLTGIPLMIGFVALTALINLLISSASAKWAMLAPIFVPLFMQLGKSPEAVQAFYRVGDSVTNIITPLNIYFPILLAVVHRYVPSAGMGTLIAAMIPYSIAFFAFWSAMVALWVGFGWPLGPGAPLEYRP